MRIKEIEARLAAIKQEIETRGAEMTAAEIDALEQETTQLTEERAGLIAAAGLSVVQVSMFHLDLYQQTGVLLDMFDFKKLAFFVIAFVAIKKFKLHPIVYIACAAVVGLVLQF